MKNTDSKITDDRRLNYFLAESRTSIFLNGNHIKYVLLKEPYILFAGASLTEWQDCLENDSWEKSEFIIIDCSGVSKELQKKAIPIVKDKTFGVWHFEDKHICVTASSIDELDEELRGFLITV